MAVIFRTALVLVLAGLISGGSVTPGFAYGETDRTVNRSVLGYALHPDWIYNKPEHYEFTPLVSNHDPQNDHPAAWEGQDWDTSRWGRSWTADKALQKFFEARIFERQYMGGPKMPVLELGPAFYKLSDLDRRRTLKLLTDHTSIFKNYTVVALVDWWTHDRVGTYTPKGLFLD